MPDETVNVEYVIKYLENCKGEPVLVWLCSNEPLREGQWNQGNFKLYINKDGAIRRFLHEKWIGTVKQKRNTAEYKIRPVLALEYDIEGVSEEQLVDPDLLGKSQQVPAVPFFTAKKVYLR